MSGHSQKTNLSPFMREELLRAIAKLPRDFVISDGTTTPEKVAIPYFACQGEGGTAQMTVAKILEQKLANAKVPFGLLGGGHGSATGGITSPIDASFQRTFYQPYQRLGIPFFLALSHHDHDLKARIPAPNPLAAENQIMHTYLNERGEIDRQKLALFQTGKLDVATLKAKQWLWLMPRQYYSVQYGHTVFCMMDSSRYAREYLAHLADPSHADNQAAFLSQWVKKVSDDEKLSLVLVWHHPPYHTAGKRAFNDSVTAYLRDDEQKKLQSLGVQTDSYPRILSQILERQKLNFFLSLCGHDRMMYCYHEANRRQIVVGSGGSELQKLESLKALDKVPYYLAEHGFASLTLSQQEKHKLEIDFHAVSGKHLRFAVTKSSFIPLHHGSYSAEQQTVKALLDEGIATYRTFLSQQQAEPNPGSGFFKQNLLHSVMGVNRLYGLINYLNSHQVVSSYEQWLLEIYLMIGAGSSGNSQQRSLLGDIDQCFKKQYGCNFNLFLSEPHRPSLSELEQFLLVARDCFAQQSKQATLVIDKQDGMITSVARSIAALKQKINLHDHSHFSHVSFNKGYGSSLLQSMFTQQTIDEQHSWRRALVESASFYQRLQSTAMMQAFTDSGAEAKMAKVIEYLKPLVTPKASGVPNARG